MKQTITGKLRIVTLKSGGANLSIDLDPNTDWGKIMPVLFNMALHPVSISPAGFEAESEQSDPLKDAQRACEVISQALLELSEGMEAGKQPELALRASDPFEGVPNEPHKIAPRPDEPTRTGIPPYRNPGVPAPPEDEEETTG